MTYNVFGGTLSLTQSIIMVHLFTESYFTDIDNIVPCENTTPINQNKNIKIKECRAGWSD